MAENNNIDKNVEKEEMQKNNKIKCILTFIVGFAFLAISAILLVFFSNIAIIAATGTITLFISCICFVFAAELFMNRNSVKS